MCGIFALLSKEKRNTKQIEEAFDKIKTRGLDNHDLKSIHPLLTFGFHRLSINDTSFQGNQPLYHPHKPYVLICNGEIYNFKELLENQEPLSNSDCEVILYLYEKYGMERTLSLLDSEAFAFCLYDGELNTLFVARDRFGVRPLFVGKEKNEFIFGSEAKAILPFSKNIQQFSPGTFKKYRITEDKGLVESQSFLYREDFFPRLIDNTQEDFICNEIYRLLRNAVRKRLLSDRPIGCLLSGGLDSSIISSLVAKELKAQNFGPLHTFSIGLKNSPDLHYSKIVSAHIGSFHHHVEFSESEFLKAIPEVIYQIESYDTTTVRASVGNYLIGKYIAETTDIKVVFNGDGSDEQSGYLYLKNAPSADAFQNECIRLLEEIHYFDVLRSDRCLSSRFSLETRTPFLDSDFVNFYMSIPPELKMYTSSRMEKYLLRKAFEKELPPEVTWRPKEAFSDGCSSPRNSWHEIIQRWVDTFITNDEFETQRTKYTHNPPVLKESFYYRKIFEKEYKNCDNLIPHFWLPKWCESQHDPSARQLDIYASFDQKCS